MGHRTYLIRSSPQESDEIFEANNILPFFWLTLVQEQDVVSRIPEMKKDYSLWEDEEAYEQYQDNNTGVANIKVDKRTALRNAYSATAFIAAFFPKAADLYTDFVNYIDSNLKDSDFLELDIISLANFSDIDTLISNILEDVKAIKQQNADKVSGYFQGDVGFGLTGYNDDFAAHSPTYQQAVNTAEELYKASVVKQTQLNKSQLRSRRLKAILLLSIGVLFAAASCAIIYKQGLSFSAVMSLLLGAGAVWLSITKLTSNTHKVR